MNMFERKIRLLDPSRSCLTPSETATYKDEITKQKNNPVCATMATFEVADLGASAMEKDEFHLVEEQLDV